jgi:hypothetical protein
LFNQQRGLVAIIVKNASQYPKALGDALVNSKKDAKYIIFCHNMFCIFSIKGRPYIKAVVKQPVGLKKE